MRRDIKTQDIVAMFTVQHLSTGQIQKLIGMSRPAIIKRLHKAGIQTGKGPKSPTHVKCYCDFCGKEFELLRSRWKKSIRHFCSDECYFAYLENPNYYQWRHGQRLARAIVSQYVELAKENVVHHKDGNCRNNNIENLAVYKDQSDHIKAHRENQNVKPIWDGSNPEAKGLN